MPCGLVVICLVVLQLSHSVHQPSPFIGTRKCKLLKGKMRWKDVIQKLFACITPITLWTILKLFYNLFHVNFYNKTKLAKQKITYFSYIIDPDFTHVITNCDLLTRVCPGHSVQCRVTIHIGTCCRNLGKKWQSTFLLFSIYEQNKPYFKLQTTSYIFSQGRLVYQ